MNELANIRAMDPSALRQGEYLVSLLAEARRVYPKAQAAVIGRQIEV